jgi:hypothetical protein
MKENQAVAMLRTWAADLDAKYDAHVLRGLTRPLSVTIDGRGPGFRATLHLYVTQARVNPYNPNPISWDSDFQFSGYVDLHLNSYGLGREDTIGAFKKFDSISGVLDHLYDSFVCWYDEKQGQLNAA